MTSSLWATRRSLLMRRPPANARGGERMLRRLPTDPRPAAVRLVMDVPGFGRQSDRASAAGRGVASARTEPPGRGGCDRHIAGRSARDGMADRSAHGAIAGASQLRRVARSDGGGARGAWDGVYAHAVLA